MAFQVKKGSFSFPEVTTPLEVTGVGFQPKAVLFWLTRQTAAGYAADRSFGMSFAVSSTQRGGFAFYSLDNATVTTSMLTRIVLDQICLAFTTTTDTAATFTSMDADGFTIDPIVFAAGKGWLVHYLAVGGTDLTNAWAGNIDVPLAAGQQGYADPGFQPDFLLLLTNTTGTIPRSDTGHRMSLGVSDGTNSAVAYSYEQATLATSVQSFQTTGEVIHTFNSGGTANTVATLASMDADGFTLDYSTVPGSTARGVLALALKGGQYKVTTDTQKTSAGTKAKTGVGFTPTGLLLFGTNRTTSASLDSATSKFSIGASDGTTEGCVWGSSTDNVSTTDENQATVTDKILRHATNPSTTDAEADLSAFDSDGYTLNWSAADATAREFVAVAFGSEVGAAGGASNMMLLGVG